MAIGNKGQKCQRFGKVKKRVCADFTGGKGKGGKGKRCVKRKVKKVRICRDYA